VRCKAYASAMVLLGACARAGTASYLYARPFCTLALLAFGHHLGQLRVARFDAVRLLSLVCSHFGTRWQECKRCLFPLFAAAAAARVLVKALFLRCVRPLLS
jgi:hypothetical protein